MKFKTVTGSLYEIDLPNNRVRRLTGTKAVTNHQNDDGDWQDYLEVSEVKVGVGVFITWRYDIVEGDTIARNTLTSDVAEII